jgi:hypothetical protein
VIRIGAAPDATGFVEQIAFLGIRTAAGYNAWRVRQIINRVDNLGFEGDFMAYMITIADLDDFPFFLCHRLLQVTFIVYGISGKVASDRRHEWG